MTDKAWKVTERRLCAYFCMKRTPLSGGNSGHATRADCIPDESQEPCPFPRERVYVEVKHSGGGKAKPAAILTLFKDTKKKAKAEKRFPIVINHAHGEQDADVATIQLRALVALLRIAAETHRIGEVFTL